MDEIKQAATGGPATVSQEDTFAPIDDANEIPSASGDTFAEDKGGLGAYSTDSRDDPSPLETPTDNPDLEQMRKSMQADYTRKTQELAEQRRENERQMAQMMQQMQMMQQGQQPTQAQKQEIKGILDRIPQSVRANMEPEAQQVLETLETVVRDEVDSRLKSALQSDEIGGLRRSIEELRQQQWLAQKQQESNVVTQRYGQDRIQPYMTQIATTLQQNPGLTVEQALMHVAPQVVQQHWMEQGLRRAQQQKKQQDQAALEAMRAGPSADPTVGFRDGESMIDSARAVLGASMANLEQ